ncbi:MAG TPA: response regulator [Nitrospirota bacterium]|nr:response regulator [Nitrospirota bacterium]
MDDQRPNITYDNCDRKTQFLLVVDSDTNNLFYMSMVLQRMDYQISTAINVEEAMAIANIIAPSLIITALDLKDRSGLELIQQCRQNHSIARVPIIAIRKQDDLHGEKCCRKLGATECLAQPISAEKLFRSVQAAIETKPRGNIRIRTLLSVRVNGVPLNGFGGLSAVELSERGMFLYTIRASPVNTKIAIQIDLNQSLLDVEARVIYNTLTVGNFCQEPGMGVEFTRISPRDREFIRQYISDELTRGIAPANE